MVQPLLGTFRPRVVLASFFCKPLGASASLKLFISLNCFCLFFRTAPAAYGGSQARGQIRAPASGWHHSHSNMRSKPCLQPTPQLTVTLDPRPTDQGQGLNPRPQGHYCITTGTSELFFTEPFLWDSASFWSPDCTGPRELGRLHLGVRHLALDALVLLGRSLGHAWNSQSVNKELCTGLVGLLSAYPGFLGPFTITKAIKNDQNWIDHLTLICDCFATQVSRKKYVPLDSFLKRSFSSGLEAAIWTVWTVIFCG